MRVCARAGVHVSARPFMRACMRACLRACVCVRLRACARACVRACLPACLPPACERACVRARVRACVFARPCVTHACLPAVCLLACPVACPPATLLAYLHALCTRRLLLLIMCGSFHNFKGCAGCKNAVLDFWKACKFSRPLSRNKSRPRTVTTDIASSHFLSLIFVLKAASIFYAPLIPVSEQASGQGCEIALDTPGIDLGVETLRLFIFCSICVSLQWVVWVCWCVLAKGEPRLSAFFVQHF